MYKRLFEKLFTQSSQALFHCDARGHIIAVNEAALTLLGDPAELLLGRPLEHLVQGDSASLKLGSYWASGNESWQGHVSCRGVRLSLSLTRVRDGREEAVLAALEPAFKQLSALPLSAPQVSALQDYRQDHTEAQVFGRVGCDTERLEADFASEHSPSQTSTKVQAKPKFDPLSLSVFHVDRQWRVTYLNDIATKTSADPERFTPEAVLGRSLWQVLPYLNEADNPFAQAYRYAMATGESVYVEGKARDPDVLWKVHCTYIIPTGDGLLVHSLDRTEQKYAEQAIARALQEREAMFNSIADYVLVLDSQWRFVYANDAAQQQYPQGFIGKPYFDVFATGTLFEEKYRQVFNTKRPAYFEAQNHLDGAWLEMRVFPSGDNIIIYGVDISERKRLALQLEQALSEKEDILNSITDSVVVIDRAWRFVYANNNALRFNPDILGKSYWDVYPHNRGTLFEHYYQQVLETGEPARFTTQATKSGDWLEVRVFPNTEGIAVYVADISELKEKETALERALAAKELLIKEVHHRTKNNMQLISSMLSIQIHSLKDEDSRQAVADSRDRINVLADVHRLMYQQLDSETVNTEVHLRGLLQKLARSMTKRAITVDTDIAAFEVTIHQAIPLGLIVNELFTNALKHAFREPSADDVIVVRLWLEADEQVVLELADNGVGLSVDFDANQDTLGMTIIQSLVGQLDGAWSLTNGDAAGSVARVQFPKGKLAKENGQLLN